MTMDHNLSAGIQPAHIIGNRSVNLDHGVRKSQGPQPLPGMACHIHVDQIISSPPEPAADSVLSKRLDREMPVSAGKRFLNPLFQDSGIQPDPLRYS